MASLKAIYQNYQANPAASTLNENASLNYITTLTTIQTAAAIVKHNAAHQKVLRKKEEKILSCVEGSDAICLDVETTVEFVSGGGAYLPGLDDNFLADRVVTFPMVHIVHFDSKQKIQQVRLYWDQGSLLKLVDVIGARARSWPIHDGKDQARLIASSAARMTPSNGFSRPSTTTSDSFRGPNEAGTTNKAGSPSKNVTRDPHASSSLYAPHEQDEVSSQLTGARIPKGQSAKPPPRDYHDLFVGNNSDVSPQASKSRAMSPTKENGGRVAPKSTSAKPPPRDYHDLFVGQDSDVFPISKGKAPSPQKENMTPAAVAPKAGAGKNFKPSRLFDVDGPEPGTPGSPEKHKGYKVHTARYDHFELGAGSEYTQPLAARPKAKHQSNWDFEDFMTPEKAPTKVRGQDARHFGWRDDELDMDSPAKHAAAAKARPDANTNFEFQDDGTPASDRRPAGHPRGMGNVKGTGLYQNNVFDEGASPEKKNHPLATVTNLKDRRKDLDPHFDMADDSPASNANQQAPIPEARAKVVSQMGAQWEATDSSPGPQSRSKDNEDRINPISGDKENNPRGGRNKRNTGIKTSGDGMGGKKGAGRSWGFGSDGDDDGVKFQASKIQQAPKDSGLWDF